MVTSRHQPPHDGRSRVGRETKRSRESRPLAPRPPLCRVSAPRWSHHTSRDDSREGRANIKNKWTGEQIDMLDIQSDLVC